MRALRPLSLILSLLAGSASAQVINSNTNWSGTVALDRDVRVEPGVTLTVAAGTIITSTTTDAANLGTTAGKVELIIRGTLVVNGTAGAPVTFTSAGTSAGSWVGLRVETGGSVTLTNAIVEEATIGLDANANVTVTGATFRTNTYGVQANAGTGSIGTSFFSGNSYGVYGSGGAVTVDHSTLVANAYGVYSGSSSGAVTVTNSVLTNNSSYGLYRSSSAVVISNSFNDVWQNSSSNYGNTSAGTGSFSANPLYVTTGSNYRLTSNSPARNSDSTGGDLGALPYTSDATPGLVGTLWSNTTLASGTLTGDLTIAPGVTATVPASVTLTAGTSDLMQAGNDTGRVELIVRGTLNVSGATLSSSGASAGAWVGVRVESGGALTLAGSTVEKATIGLDLLSGATITGSTFRTNTYGVQANGGTSSIGTSFFSGNSYGVYGAGGAVSVDHSTLVSNAYGVYSGSSSGSVTVTNSVLTNNSSYGLYRSSSAVVISNSYNDVWQNSAANYGNTSAGTGSFSSNPLYVTPGSNYRLTSNSPARNADSTGGDLGAFPYTSDATPGLLGTQWSNTTLSNSTLTGDLTIPSGVTVTLPAGVTLTAATSDQLQAGNDTGRVELIVYGTLSVTGTTGLNAVLTSSGAGAGSWVGVRVMPGGSVSASGLVMEKATVGFDTAGTLTVTGSTFRTNTYGVQANAGTTSVGTSFFTGNSYGLYGSGGALVVDHSTLVSNAYGVYSGSSSGSVTVTNSVLTNNSSYGLYRSSSAAVISNSYNDVWQNSSSNYGNTSAGIGSITINPLYVTSGSNYRLTSNSPARNSDSTGGDMGAFPYVSDATTGLLGTLWANTTLVTGTMSGDLTIPAGVTVTVPLSTVLTARRRSDQMQAGNDTGRVELIVRGTLNVTGATLTSSGASAGAWVGVRLESGGALTFSNSTVEKATIGLDLSGGATISGSTFRTNTYGVQVQAGSTGIASSFFSGNSYGVYGSGGAVSVDHSTLVSNAYGVYSGSSSGSVTVTNSVLTNNSSYGLYRSSSAAVISNGYNDVWQNSSANYGNTSAGTGSISSNPLYVTAGSNYRLTSNSPARKSDSMGGDMGAFAYVADPTPSLVGTLWVDTTVSTNTNVPGDLTVAPGVTLTVGPGVTLTHATSDLMQAGNDTGRAELIVNGSLVTNGTPAAPVVITSTGASAGAWVGIRVQPGGSANLTSVAISRATIGVEANANVAIADSVLTGNTYGVQVDASATSITRSFFSQNSYGAYGSGGALTLDHSTLVSNAYGVYSGSSSGSVSVTNSVLTNNSSYGLYRSSSAVVISNSYNDVWQNSSSNYGNTSAGTGSISGNPLYVTAGSNYRLTSNSPARKSDSTGGDMGAFPYLADPTLGLVGTLWTNTTLSTSANLLGDLTVAPGVTLTLAPGVTLTAPASDLMQSGDDTGRTELIVNGTLQASGTAASPVVLTTSGAMGAWVGVKVPAGGTASLSGLTVQRASTCLDLFGSATVTGSRFNACSTGVRSNAGSQSVSFTVFDGNSYGAYGAGGGLTLDHLTVYGNAYGVYSGSSSGSLTVTNSIFSSNSSYGLYRSSSAVGITNSYNLLFNSNTGNTTLGSNTLSAVDPLLVAPASADYHLQATSPARMAGTSSSDLGAFPFAPGAVDRVVISPVSATVVAGGTFTFSATAYDAANNPVPTATITWSALTAAGVINSAGVLTASCTPGAVTGGVTASANGKLASANLTITTAPIASLVVMPASAVVKSQQTQAFSVMARDACNNPVASPAITWSATGSAGIVDSSGVYTAGCSRGAYPNAIVATAGAIMGTASVTVDPGVLANVSLSPTTASVAVNGTRQFTGSAADGCGNPLSTAVTYGTTVTGATINTSGLFTAGTTPGTFTGGVTAAASEGPINRSAAATVTVTGGNVATVMVMPSTATLSAGGTATFSALALDGFGNMVAGSPTWSVVAGGGSINASSGVFTAGTMAGTFTGTVRAVISGVSGFGSVVVQPGAITRVVVAPAIVTLAPGGSTTFTAQAFDANNNLVSAPTTWAASAASGAITQGGVFTAGTMSGNYPSAITATASGVSGTADVSINAGALSQLSITPAVATTQAGGTLAFTASGRDGNNNTVAVTPTWSVVAGGGSISTMGVFSAGTATGTFANTVRAESSGVTAFATVSVTAGPLVRIELTPPSADLLEGSQQQFTGAGQDAFGNPVATSLVWAANSNAGSITASGLFTAGSLPGDYADGVTATDGVVMATANVRVRSLTVMDAGTDAGMEEDAGTTTDAGTMGTDAGMTADAGTMLPDGGSGTVGGTSGCGCTQLDGFAPLLGLVVLALRRRRRR